eukprot:NODE_5048_length_430_cov_140.811024_g4381_i0.p1 GENE.NODE_5048_length_430_cov_140.811024_g4381_i0~~NODE_5048_length_430_cov_140.811024_g4381_i0.p1  ORF type:complete len:53 (+),score=4.10 NODE_5048_length_430_cov_140.811024_g4381_i0:246-404(+)
MRPWLTTCSVGLDAGLQNIYTMLLLCPATRNYYTLIIQVVWDMVLDNVLAII